MTRLSVNVNKVATLRNSRGGSEPSVLEAVDAIVEAGARGITVHPRQDERHIRRDDVFAVAERLSSLRNSVEYNIEGDPRPDWVQMVLEVKPHQCTLVPVRPGEVTSEAGWPADTPLEALTDTIAALKDGGVRVSVFVDPDRAPIEWAAKLGADRVELYTEPYARAFEVGGGAAVTSLTRYGDAIRRGRALGLGVNAGHDLDLDNLGPFLGLGGVDEVSIGHALMSRALFRGLGPVVREYRDLIARTG